MVTREVERECLKCLRNSCKKVNGKKTKMFINSTGIKIEILLFLGIETKIRYLRNLKGHVITQVKASTALVLSFLI